MEYFLSIIYRLSIAEHCKTYYSRWWLLLFFPHCLLTSTSLENVVYAEMYSSDLLSEKDSLPSCRTAVSPWDRLSCRKPTGSNTCSNLSQRGPYSMTNEGRDMNAQMSQPYVASLRSHFSSTVPCGVSWGCHLGLSPTLISPYTQSC